MAYEQAQHHYQALLAEIEAQGLSKNERVLTSAQDREIQTTKGRFVNFCANNYLGLANHPQLLEAAVAALKSHGFGLASVRFICGTQDLHKQLEESISRFLEMEDAILYSSCFDANGGLFETLLGENDAILSDQLNHASIIDGIRLCKARRLRYSSGNLAELEEGLRSCQDARIRMISTDGVFSMDGTIARLKEICDLAERYGAMLHVDDSHATGFMGARGKGTHEHCSVMGRVDLITSTLGKALGGASGGFTAGRRELIATLRQRSRPYLFSNTLPPALVAAGLKVIEMLETDSTRRQTLAANTALFRSLLVKQGLSIIEGIHPIVPVMVGDARLAGEMAEDLLAEGIYVIGFSYPVVPLGKARIRVQVSAAHSEADLRLAATAFGQVARRRGLLPAS
jgi:glycine C-acetyltransferase